MDIVALFNLVCACVWVCALGYLLWRGEVLKLCLVVVVILPFLTVSHEEVKVPTVSTL